MTLTRPPRPDPQTMPTLGLERASGRALAPVVRKERAAWRSLRVAALAILK